MLPDLRALHPLQRRLVPLVVWTALAARAVKSASWWRTFTDNVHAWNVARRALAGRYIDADATPLICCTKPRPDALRGRVIAITGAGEGIGRALALAAAAHGAEVVLIGRTVSKLEAVHGRIGELGQVAASIAPLDLERALARDYDALADAVRSRFGRLDGLVHNAGILGALAPIEHYDVPTWCRVLHVNLTAPFALTQVLLPLLHAAPDASIIFTSSGVGRRPRAYWGAYGLEVRHRSAVRDAGRGGQQRRPDAGQMQSIRGRCAPACVHRRIRPRTRPQLARPEDVLGPYLWLLSAASRGVNGQSLDCQPGPQPD